MISCTELKVTITVDYTSAPDEAPGELAANEFTAGSILYLICEVEETSGNLSYSWFVDGNSTLIISTSSTLILEPLFSTNAGNYTCSVSESGRPETQSSDSYTVRVVGNNSC